ncbi:osmoprotectant transport system ATP-binding protein [Sphingomonas vulcanisoli]|uniref:Osmoprotectant transport system ATP-binding protein n=1 Tax=Sphingomonas vulcanisoli TaxID=1658060 RepID=A0ABX0TWW1_9SPHN|nr:ATP-binding cassette domain-containing protein [Sphingomonas vulcanisoli]NIJ08629.1 osmoprotectant transport system ATP-binding protein [Sphingomonas vulcanisoli]
MSAEPALAFEAVVRRHGTVTAVDGVSVAIAAGRFVALVGTSGSGKSSLLRMANRLDAPDDGRVLRDGRDVAGLDPIKLRRETGYVFQNIGLFPHMSVAENIAIGPRLCGESVDVAARLRQVGLPEDHARRMPAELSGGQQQRVGIARALAGGGKLLLMDEPFGALDPVTRDQLGRTVRALHASEGLTTILVTHDMAEALLLADRVLVMAKGRIVGDATPAEMLAGKAGAEAAALVAVPRDQAERLKALGG